MQKIIVSDGHWTGARVIEDDWLQWINHTRQPILDPIMKTLSSMELWVAVGLILFSISIYRKKDWKMMLGMFVSLGVCDGFVFQVLKPSIARLRPCYQIDNLVLFANKCGGWWGLPSNHAANGMTVAVFLLMMGKEKLGWFTVLLVLTVGYSRVYSGVHYPADVIFGFMCGAIIGTLGGVLFQKFESHFS